jgi:hypothetical protein
MTHQHALLTGSAKVLAVVHRKRYRIRKGPTLALSALADGGKCILCGYRHVALILQSHSLACSFAYLDQLLGDFSYAPVSLCRHLPPKIVGHTAIRTIAAL